MIFTRRYRYRFGDMDVAGIAYYPTYFHYFHCCFEDWWAEGVGTPYPRVILGEKFGLPAVHSEIDWRRPLRYGDEPDVSLGITRLGETSVEFAYWMALESHPEPTCTARVVTVSTDLQSMTKQPIPARWREVFERWRAEPHELPGGLRRR